MSKVVYSKLDTLLGSYPMINEELNWLDNDVNIFLNIYIWFHGYFKIFLNLFLFWLEGISAEPVSSIRTERASGCTGALTARWAPIVTKSRFHNSRRNFIPLLSTHQMALVSKEEWVSTRREELDVWEAFCWDAIRSGSRMLNLKCGNAAFSHRDKFHQGIARRVRL